MASIEKCNRNGQLRWYARYRDPVGTQLVEVFDRRADPERFLTTVEASKLTGHYIDVRRASIKSGDVAEEHRSTCAHALAADTTRPRKRSVLEPTPLHHRALVITLIGLGLRISEACGPRAEDVGFLRRVVHVRRQRRPAGATGQLKTNSSARDIPADDTVLDALAERIRYWPRRDGLIFSSTIGRPLTKSIAGHVLDHTERDVGFTVSPHSLRRYFGASLISRGVSVIAASRGLGPSSPEVTYRVYACLKPDDESAGRTALAETMRSTVPDVYPLRTRQASE